MRFFRTSKEQLLWERTFHILTELQDVLRAFRVWYTANWLNQRHGHRTPDQVRANQPVQVMADRHLPVAA
ncbi:hypothetical protein CKO28_23225 [Rhodovibrio sodomensis]|uniref:Integrase catalytic domain-containing protein n=1 Tax=Rhodovibrio sodomensis TaxID=1088 RepID=A0ABS1DMH2_9PROT|nr:hypothetical protein [Rhodovibrio sodomensis]MBK1670928.1 hypothetical protein [Rhodovibrio sodomensis]